jgi:2-oxoisovalerate dehydrogenase E2 component (dihydrolipoyl transacylase)
LFIKITKELARLQQLASDNKLSSEDVSGGTITLSNIGAIGGKFGSPLLNLPEVSIIAIGRIQKVPQFTDDGNVYPASLMTVSLAYSHSSTRSMNKSKPHFERNDNNLQ